MRLRPYQQAAVDAVVSESGPSLVKLPTGAGKTHVILALMRHYAMCGHRVLVLSHSVDLVRQTSEKLRIYSRDLKYSMACSSLGGVSFSDNCILGTIQTIHSSEFASSDSHVIIVDECHLIPRDSDSMYRQLLSRVNCSKLIGLTATPYRLDGGLIYGRSESHLFDHITYSANIKDLTNEGYLCRIVERLKRDDVESLGLRIVAKEFDQDQASDNVMKKIEFFAAEVRRIAERHKSVLVFLPSIETSQAIASALGDLAESITSDTPYAQRADIIERFMLFDLRVLCNVNVCSIGFDAPNIDAIVMIRPTQSQGLYYQMVGRGLRIHPDKSDCTLYDYAGNYSRFGSIYEMDDYDLGKSSRRKKTAEKQPNGSSVSATRQRRELRDSHLRNIEGAEDGTHRLFEVFGYRASVTTSRAGNQCLRIDLRVGFGVYISLWFVLSHNKPYVIQLSRQRLSAMFGGFVHQLKDLTVLVNLINSGKCRLQKNAVWLSKSNGYWSFVRYASATEVVG